MRVVFAVALVALLAPAPLLAQTSPPAAPAAANPAPAATHPRRGGDISRDDYVERAKQNAEKRFDAMDTNHDGMLTSDERRAYRASHSKSHPAEPQ